MVISSPIITYYWKFTTGHHLLPLTPSLGVSREVFRQKGLMKFCSVGYPTMACSGGEMASSPYTKDIEKIILHHVCWEATTLCL